ncbi:rodlin [Streptomyces sp. P9(2023)]|uniref:rodlin n=1 Tax=Streptomyces sp. P9(2023) TaxID=3064394 RepID=UPI0028F3EF55|nr:rodlin [Streptomyces sp. P9(2023)]MDT9693504.1 rodlin [Streptomyces sp. P9(2023)]
MIKKVLATAAVAASVVGMSAATASAQSDDGNSSNVIGNQSKQSIGSNSTGGYMSPNFGLVNGGVLHCFDIQKLQAQVPVGVIAVPVAVQDVLGNDMSNQTCTQNSTQQTGDDPLSNILREVLSGNGNVQG